MNASRMRLVEGECRLDVGGVPPGHGPFSKVIDPARQHGAGQRRARLARAIELEVVPRLVLAHRVAAAAPALPEAAAPPDALEVTALADLVLTQDVGAVSAYLMAVRARGVTVEALYLDLLAPAARHLGELWVADLCDFTDVTVGLCRLQQVLHELGPAFRGEVAHEDHNRRALLAPVPGEQHSFGLSMVAEFFRRAGWDVWSGPASSGENLIRVVRNEWFAVVGLSVSCEVHFDELTACVRGIRRASRNRAVGVMVGGPTFTQQPELAALIGADATAPDGRQAAAQAQSMVSLLARRG